MPSPDNLAATVISVGKMAKTVTVRLATQKWNNQLSKNFRTWRKLLVHDHNDSLVSGDVITLVKEKHARHVNHAVREIVAPFGIPIEERPPVLTLEQREALREAYVLKKRRGKQELMTEAKRQLEEDIAALAARASAGGATTSTSAEANTVTNQLAEDARMREQQQAAHHGVRRESTSNTHGSIPGGQGLKQR